MTAVYFVRCPLSAVPCPLPPGFSQAEEANLPETMCRLSVGMRSVAEVRTLVRAAKALMLNTPKSFRKILRSSLYANLSQVRG